MFDNEIIILTFVNFCQQYNIIVAFYLIIMSQWHNCACHNYDFSCQFKLISQWVLCHFDILCNNYELVSHNFELLLLLFVVIMIFFSGRNVFL